VDVEAYLRRIEYDGPRQPSAASLRVLHRQHLFTVPFENLDIALKVPLRLDLAQLFDKIVVRRRGGFCYELNGLFCELLRRRGFQVQMLSARVRNADGSYGPEFDHMLLKVELEETWLADVGFGESFVDPIAFCAGGASEVHGRHYSVVPIGDEWQLVREDEKGQSPQYRFRDVPRRLADYAVMCRFHQTSPDSHFTRGWTCSKATPEGRTTLANMRLIVTRSGTREERLLTTEAEVRSCLRDQFGIELPGSDLSVFISSS